MYVRELEQYWIHVEYKKLLRCFILLVPVVGNIYALAKDYFEYKEDKASFAKALPFLQEAECFQASCLAILATQQSGIKVTSEQVMPAEREEQQRLWLACSVNDLPRVRKLLHKGISPNFYHSGYTPLVSACQKSSANIIRLLIDHGAKVDASDRYGNYPLSESCKKGAFAIVKLLHPHIRDINRSNNWATTPLIFAAYGGDPSTVAYLLEHGADPRKSDYINNTALHFAAKHPELLRPILEKCSAREFVNQQNNAGFTALQQAIALGQPEAAILLLKTGADPFIGNTLEEKPIICACKNDLLDVVEYIQQHHTIDPDIQEQVAKETRAAKARSGKGALSKEKESLSYDYSLIEQTLPETIQTRVKNREEYARLPRTGMEIFLGTLKCPF